MNYIFCVFSHLQIIGIPATTNHVVDANRLATGVGIIGFKRRHAKVPLMLKVIGSIGHNLLPFTSNRDSMSPYQCFCFVFVLFFLGGKGGGLCDMAISPQNRSSWLHWDVQFPFLSVQNLNLYTAINGIALEECGCERTTLAVTRNIRLSRPAIELLIWYLNFHYIFQRLGYIATGDWISICGLRG